MTNQTAFINQFPHCDGGVLHAPGECEFCDHRKDLQGLREVWHINFTGHHDVDKTKCPAEKDRKLEDINLWSGNRAKPKAPQWARALVDQLFARPITPDDAAELLYREYQKLMAGTGWDPYF